MGRPTSLRPFVCDGSPLDCEIFIVGANAATAMGDFWDFWLPGVGMDKAAWFAAYKAARAQKPLAPGKTRRMAVSPTRPQHRSRGRGRGPVPVPRDQHLQRCQLDDSAPQAGRPQYDGLRVPASDPQTESRCRAWWRCGCRTKGARHLCHRHRGRSPLAWLVRRAGSSAWRPASGAASIRGIARDAEPCTASLHRSAPCPSLDFWFAGQERCLPDRTARPPTPPEGWPLCGGS